MRRAIRPLLAGLIAFVACDSDSGPRGWIELEPIRSAGPKDGHGLAYDAKSGKVVLFGGRRDGEETWAFDVCAKQWTQKHPPESPPAPSSVA